MGVYLDGVHKSRPIKANIGGEVKTVHRVMLICKAQDAEHRIFDAWWNKKADLINARLAAMDAAWGEGGPEYVVDIFKKPEDGDKVYKVPPTFRTHIDSKSIDQRTDGSTFVGTLKKIKGRWTVVPPEVDNSQGQ